MTVTVKNKTPLVVPRAIQRSAGLTGNEKLEFRAKGGVITITAKSTDGEETPEQRRIIDAQLAEGLDDIHKGRVSARFDTVNQMLASLKADKKAPRNRKTRS
jgi:hypothetical protein